MRIALIAAVLIVALPAQAAVTAPQFEALRAIDLRMATIAQRLVTANALLCGDITPASGALLHALTQYDPADTVALHATFGFAASIAVEAVVPGSPAALAGVRANDGVVAIDRTALTATATPPSSADRDAALAIVAARPIDLPLEFDLVRDGARRTVSVAALPGCHAAFEVLLGAKMTAQSDGRTIQIGARFFERYDDADVAVVAAHELAHVLLRHRERLDAARVNRGLLAELGRNGRLFRRTETEADRLSVALLYNAGYDPASAARFWRAHGGDVDGGLFRSRTHPSSKARAALITAAAAAIPAGVARPYIPPVLAERDRPLD